MNKKAIKNSPGYYITDTGKVYNNDGKCMKTWLSSDGYERIRLTSKIHGRRVNRTIHLLVAEAFLNSGKYANENNMQINHIDGNKANNHMSNLEEVTGTENVNHAHTNSLYTYNIRVTVRDIRSNTITAYRSLRELARYLKVSLNYLKPRIIISTKYPILDRYVFDIDYKKYINYISTIKNEKTIYVYSHITAEHYVLTSFSQISILFGISYINISKKLTKYPDIQYYVGGYTFSLNELTNVLKTITKDNALSERDIIWKKIAMNVTT